MQSNIYHLHALSALHCGTGQSAGIVDLPIARDRATNLPLVPGSSLRGVLRQDFADKQSVADPKLENILFGPRSKGEDDQLHAGALALGDAHLLLFPVRALAGIVAYVTCPFILKRYKRDIKSSLPVPVPADSEALHASNNINKINGKVVLEDLDMNHIPSNEAEAWATMISSSVFPDDTVAQTDLKQRFLILSDSVFSFLVETATEIRARIAINQDTGTVNKGALWYEENLPAETVLWGIYALSDSRAPKSQPQDSQLKAAELAEKIPKKLLLQLGGKAGVGRGLTWFINGGAK